MFTNMPERVYNLDFEVPKDGLSFEIILKH
jgi:hypothetical protein